MPKLIYIVGPSRSGSSILEAHLQKKNIGMACGELRWIFNRGLMKDDLCTCGKNFSLCAFWQTISIVQDPLKTDRLRKKFDNPIWLLINIVMNLNSYEVYKNDLKNLYTQLFLHSETIIDNSKSPFYLLILYFALKSVEVEITVIHMNRDLEGIIDSYSKDKVRSESSNKELMTKKGRLHTIVYWIAINLVSKIFYIVGARYFYLRHRDFCENPDSIINKLRMNGGKTISKYHSISGNPDRLKKIFTVKDVGITDKGSTLTKLLSKLMY